MKMKMFAAPTEEEALALVHEELGPDAVILSTYDDEQGRVEIRAAVERVFNHRFAPPEGAPVRPIFEPMPEGRKDAMRDGLAEALHTRGAPEGFIHMVSQAGARMGPGLERQGALSAGLEGVLTFAPIQPGIDRSLLLVGPHGSGKTTATAKLSLQFASGDSPMPAMSADLDVNGQSARLAALTKSPRVSAVYSPEALIKTVKVRQSEGERLVIDGPAFNATDDQDIVRLKALISCMEIEPVLVLSAAGHPLDLEDDARAYAQCGVRRVILTQLDAVRRPGAAIAAISSARLSIAQLGLGPSMESGLAPASAERIARLLLDGQPETEMLKGAA